MVSLVPSLTEPVLSSSAPKALLVLIPGPVEVHRAVHPRLEHLDRRTHDTPDSSGFHTVLLVRDLL